MNWKYKIYIVCTLVLLCAVTGAQNYPLINEVIADPQGSLESEWVELYNPGGNAVDLSGYQLGDALGWRDISDTAIWLESGNYIILAQDADRFLEYYFDFSGSVIEPVGWQILNNGNDNLRLGLIDGSTVDSFYYENVWGDNRSWERFIDAEGASHWGGSYDPSGSTPGLPNSFRYPPPMNIEIAISPDPFSPDGDGFEDETVISVAFPEGGEFDLYIHDVGGRRVRTLGENKQAIPGDISWNGCDDSGRRLPIGIYIIYLKWVGDRTEEVKKTVVIAR